MIRILWVACALISLNASAQTPSWWGKEVVSTSMAANRPRVSTTDYNNAVLIWGEGPHLVAGVTAVGGIGAFMRTDTINLTGHSVSISFWHGPEIASRGTDTVYVVYKVAPEADTSHHIYCAASFDGGYHFGLPKRVDFIGNHMGRMPTVAIGPGGHPVVAYMKSNLNYTDPQWVIATSQDYGQTFQPEVQASSDHSSLAEACDCCPAALVVSDSTVHLAYRDNLQNQRNIRVASGSLAGGTYQSISVDPQPWMVNACPASGPDIVADGDSLYSTFLNGNSSDEVFWSRWQMGDTTALVQGIASTSMAQNYPRIDARFGKKMMVWKTGAGTQAKVQARLHLLDTLFAFDVDTGTVNVPDVAVSGQGAFVVWHEVLEKRIYLKRLFYQTIGLPESVVSPSRQLLHTVDLYGRLVNPAQISSGIYIQWYSDGSYEKVWLDE